MSISNPSSRSNLLKALGPGLFFASTAIGVTHFVLCTTAGAYFGFRFLALTILALICKYPFFEFSSRYAAATGKTLLHAYRDQGNWAFYFYLFLQFTSMFTVTAAVAGVCGGLLGSVLNLQNVDINYLAGGVLLMTFLILLKGKFRILDRFIKLLTVVLFLAVLITFIAALINGIPARESDFVDASFFEKSSLLLLVGIIGWMPNGLEASVYNSIWISEKTKESGHRASLKEVLYDFNLGYLITAILAILFMLIGALTVYGTNQNLEGSPVDFTNKLIGIFTANLGPWSFYIIAITAFAAIYGTLITAWDIFARTWIYGLRMLKFGDISDDADQKTFEKKYYISVLALIGIFGFVLINWFGHSLMFLLKLATVISFVIAPILAVLNLRSVNKDQLESGFRPPNWLVFLAYLGIAFVSVLMVGFVYLQIA